MHDSSTPTLGPITSRIPCERKLITVMFADLSGFTALSEKLDPEQVRDIVNACFNALVPIVEKYGGVVERFLGDEIMALFGAPAAHENDAERALRAALDMMKVLPTLNSCHQTNLGIHFGINSGLVVAGGLGSAGREQYSVMGDAANLASRLEDASETGQILVGRRTYQMVSPLFDFEELAPIRVKGKADPVSIYRLVGLKTAPDSTSRIGGLCSPLVGRDIELGRMRSAVLSLSSGKGSVVAIVGDPGFGKSRLISELRRTAEADLPGVRWIEGHTQSYAEGMSYWVVRSVLHGLLGTSPEMPPAAVREALRKNVSALFGARADEVYPYLARLHEVALTAETEEQVKYVLPEALQNRMRHAFRDLVRVTSHAHPLVLVWEDLHWADPSSLGLLETLLPLVDDAPVLLLLVFRPKEGLIDEWHQRARASRGGEKYQVIEIAPLTMEDSMRLVENLLKIENLPEATQRMILDKAEGNPFFLEELLNSLLDAGYILREGNRAVATDAIENLEIPSRLQSVLAARIDRLPPEDKRVLQAASVLGRVFPDNVLRNLLDHDRADVSLDRAIADLQQRELIHKRRDMEYVFKHAITQEVTYESLLIARRKELHLIAAEVIEALFPEQLEELSATLAYHYERAGSSGKAVTYLMQAADRARKTYSNSEAIAYYYRALKQIRQLAGDEPLIDPSRLKTAGILEGLGEVLALTGKNDEAREAYRDAFLHVPIHDGLWQSRLHRKSGNTWIAQRQPEKAIHAYDQASAVLDMIRSEADSSWQQEWLETALNRMQGYYFMSSVAQMKDLAEKVLQPVERYGTPAQRARFFQSLVSLAFIQDRFLISEKTMGHAQTALAASQETGHKGLITLSAFLLGFSLLWRGELQHAESQLKTALAMVEQIGDMELLVTILTWLTVTYRRSGQVELVRHLAARSLEVATASRIPLYISLARANQAWTAWRDGNLPEARAHGREALEIWTSGKATVFCKWLALSPLMDIAVKGGNDAEAIEFVRTLLHPAQMHLTEALEHVLAQAVEAWDGYDAEKAHVLMQQGIELAQETGGI